MNRRLHPYLFFVIALPAFGAATQTATISDVHVATNGDKVAVEVTLSDSITPTLTFAKNPDRLIADFPNVSPKERLQHIPVGKNGVARVRIGLNHANPPTTRVVVDLDSPRPFAVEASDRKVLLNILPASATPTSEMGVSKAADTGTTTIAELSPNAGLGSIFLPVFRAAGAQSRPARVVFRVKGIAADSVYIDGGTNSGLQDFNRPAT